MTPKEKFYSAVASGKHICVGLDTDINKIPEFLLKEEYPLYTFNKEIIEATKDEAGAYKINLAFYESMGVKGLVELEKTMELIPDNLFVIGDAKRGDIGNTSKMYAKSLFEHFKFDASTLHGYMGSDSLSPFFEFEENLNFVLCLTSNPGAQDFEKQKLADGDFVYQRILKKLHEWNTNRNIGIVFGATNPEELKANIQTIGKMPVLLPGVGAQKGSIEDVVAAFKSVNSNNFTINVSRGIIYSGSGSDFAEIAKKSLNKFNNEVKSYL